MATNNKCSMCEKTPGTCLCAGCNAHFCRKHFNDHHAKLLNELDEYIEQRNTLHDQIDKIDQRGELCNTILLQIDEWQKATIEKVTQRAERIREQIVNLLSPNKVEITSRLKKLSDKLIHLKETEDFLEIDLTQVEEMINALKQDCKRLSELPLVELHVEQNDQTVWDRLIYVEEKIATSGNKHDEQLAVGEAIS
ncbi:unnamed protein product [Rotaria sp. Silwood1]|nr:unnamed protein product [Rotaria sp. Silwood1]